METNDTRRSRGRPRSDRSKAAIHAAALKLCAEKGLQNMTVDGLCREAGVGKQTIYRWWDSLEDVVFSALSDFAIGEISKQGVSAEEAVQPLDFLKTTFREVKKIRPVLTNMLTLSQLTPPLKERFFNRFLSGRREVAAIVIRRHWPDADDQWIDVAVDLMFGFMWYRLLFDHLPLGDREAEMVMAILEGEKPAGRP